MKKLLFGLGLVALSGCVTPYVVHEKPTSVKSEAVLVVAPGYFTERSEQVFPLLDAGIFNQAYANEKSKFKVIEKEKAGEIQANLVSSLNKLGFPTKTTVAPESDSIYLEVRDAILNSQKSSANIGKYAEAALAEGGDYLVIPCWTPTVTSVGAFGIFGNVNIEGYVVIADKTGKYVGKGVFYSTGVDVGGGDYDKYGMIIYGGLEGQKGLINAFFTVKK